MHTCVYTRVDSCICERRCRPEVSLGCCSTRAVHSIFLCQLSLEPEAHALGSVGWLVSPRDLSSTIECQDYKCAQPFTRLLEIKLRSLCLHEATSPAPVYYFLNSKSVHSEMRPTVRRRAEVHTPHGELYKLR